VHTLQMTSLLEIGLRVDQGHVGRFRRITEALNGHEQCAAAGGLHDDGVLRLGPPSDRGGIEVGRPAGLPQHGEVPG